MIVKQIIAIFSVMTVTNFVSGSMYPKHKGPTCCKNVRINFNGQKLPYHKHFSGTYSRISSRPLVYKNNNLKLYLTKDNQKSWVISTFNDGRTPILKSLSCEVNGNQCPEECKWQKWDDLLGLWQIDGTMRASCAEHSQQSEDLMVRDQPPEEKFNAKYMNNECDQFQRSMGCCNPAYNSKSSDNFRWTVSDNGAGGVWTTGAKSIQFKIANDKQCKGTADQKQTGTAIMNFDTNTRKTVRIRMEGVAEPDHETFELFIDDKSMVKVQASSSSSCEANTCRMCEVSKKEQEFSIGPGNHVIRIEVDTKDAYFHKDAYFRIDFSINEYDTCEFCKCPQLDDWKVNNERIHDEQPSADDNVCEDTLDLYSKDLKNVNCTHIVNSDYCGNKYYGKWCCKSCAIAIESKLTEKQPIDSTEDNIKKSSILATEPGAEVKFIKSNLITQQPTATESTQRKLERREIDKILTSVTGINAEFRSYQLQIAEKNCKEFGKEWKITRTTPGSLVCSKVSYLFNCHNCETWRLLVWEDGACDQLATSRCRSNTTKAGEYYCGYSPCKTGDLVHGGQWHNNRLK